MTYEFETADLVEFWEMLGYSISGFADLSFIPDGVYDEAEKAADELQPDPRRRK